MIAIPQMTLRMIVRKQLMKIVKVNQLIGLIVMMERKSGFTKLMMAIGIVKMEKMNPGAMILGIIGTEKFISLKVSTSIFLDTLT